MPQVKRAMTTWVTSVKHATTDRERKEVRKGGTRGDRLPAPGHPGHRRNTLVRH